MILVKRLKALSDATRLRLFYLLLNYELNVNEIVTVIGMVQSGVSRHLKILVESDLLNSRKDGSFIYYSGNQNDENLKITGLVNSFLANEPQCIEDIENAKKIITQRKKKTKIFFKNVAKEWDLLKKEVLGDFDLNSEIKKRIQFKGLIADLGCGTGELIKLIQPMKNKLIGVDSSPEMLEQARTKLALYPNIELRLGELEYLPMKNKEVHCAIMNMVLHHISVPQEAIIEIHRVLADEGLLILSDFQKHEQQHVQKIIGGSWLGFTKEQVKAWFEKAGFKIKTITSFTVNHGLCINLYCAIKI